MKSRLQAVTLAFLALLPLGHANEEKTPHPTIANGSYADISGCTFDFWAVPGKIDAPLIICIHGGGFIRGDRHAYDRFVAPALKAGFAVMSIDYPLLPQKPVQEILHLCGRAVQYARHNASAWHIDPHRIVCTGGSAGAGTALWIAVHPNLADPKSSDPVARESSRISAAALFDTQCTYNMYRWAEYIGFPGPISGFDFFSPTQLYHFPQDSETPPQDPAIQAMLRDVDMMSMISADTPPLILRCKFSPADPANRGDYVHHPRHDQAIMKRAAEFNVPTDYLQVADGIGPTIDLLEYFKKHPLKPTP